MRQPVVTLKIWYQSQALSAGQILLGMPRPDTGVPESKSWLYFPSNVQLMCSLRVEVMTGIIGSLSPTWDTQIKFWAPGFGWLYPMLTDHLEGKPVKRKIFISAFVF